MMLLRNFGILDGLCPLRASDGKDLSDSMISASGLGKDFRSADSDTSGQLDIKEVSLYVPGTKIEVSAILNRSDSAPIIVFFHPDAALGGSMSTRVVRILSELFKNMGCAVIRFNLRPMSAKHATSISAVPTEDIFDSHMVINWALDTCAPVQNKSQDGRKPDKGLGTRQLWGIGYADGAILGAQMFVRRREMTRLIMINPTVDSCESSFIHPCPGPCLVVAASNDEVTKQSSIDAFVKKLTEKVRYHIEYKVLQASHGYKGETILKLISEIKNYALRCFKEDVGKDTIVSKPKEQNKDQEPEYEPEKEDGIQG